MFTAKFDPQVFFQRTENVALQVPAGEVFGLLKRSLNLPPQWASLVTRTTGDHEVVPAGAEVDGRDAEAVLFVRVTPLDVAIEEENITSRDGFACRAVVGVRLSVIPERSELLSFQKSMLGSRRVAQAGGVASYLQPAVRAALARIAAEQDAAVLVDASGSEAISVAIAKDLDGPCFAAGLVLERRPTVRFESSSYRKVEEVQHAAAVRRAEHEAARPVEEALRKARTEHVDHLTSLLSRLRELAAASPDVDLPELLRTFSERQRGELYEALFAAEAPSTKTQWVVAAAGDELLFFDARTLGAPTRRLKVAGAAGPVRSIQTANHGNGDRALLVGAATGVYVWKVDRDSPELTLLVVDAPPVRGGFNAAALLGERLFATHSELGLCEWRLGEPTSATRRFASMTDQAKTVRDVEFLDGDLYFAVDDRVLCTRADDRSDTPAHIFTGSGSAVTVICPTAEGLFAGNSDGDILRWTAGRDAEPELIHRGMNRAAESLWVLSTHGVRRLVFTDTSSRIHVRVLGDSFTCAYEAGGQTLRRVEAAPDLLVATNDLRDRLICWSSGQPDQPIATINVAALCGRSIQDACLVPTV